jgi:cytochrome c-type biogenesis protein CcmH
MVKPLRSPNGGLGQKRQRLVAGIIGMLCLCLALANGGSRPAHADGTATPTPRAVDEDEVNRISKNLFCPVCENLPLDVCQTDACVQWRGEVRDMLARGFTEAQIEQHFVARFGQRAVGTPARTETLLLTVVLPFTLIGVIGLVAGFMLIRWRLQSGPQATKSTSPETSPQEEDPYRARLEDEVNKRY